MASRPDRIDPDDSCVLSLGDIRLTRNGRDLLRDVDWCVRSHERWVVMGPNGSGKTSLIRIAALYEHPSSGRVVVAGEELGRTDIRSLRRRVALVSPALADMVRPALSCRDLVMSAKFAALEPWWHHYVPADAQRAEELLDAQGVGFTAERPFGSLSSGEKQRVMLARELMGDPALVLLDEPATGLDLGGRETLVERLAHLALIPTAPPSVLVTHHVEEIPTGYTHILALRGGRVSACGPLEETLSSAMLSELFETPLELFRHDDGRFSARRSTRRMP